LSSPHEQAIDSQKSSVRHQSVVGEWLRAGRRDVVDIADAVNFSSASARASLALLIVYRLLSAALASVDAKTNRARPLTPTLPAIGQPRDRSAEGPVWPKPVVTDYTKFGARCWSKAATLRLLLLCTQASRCAMVNHIPNNNRWLFFWCGLILGIALSLGVEGVMFLIAAPT